LNFGEVIGGAERDRTAGLLVANEALSQLSYSPTTLSILSAGPDSRKGRTTSRLVSTSILAFSEHR
jgi:hypothetical protein